MAFPGGREEPHDETVRRTAERETMEEIGLDLRGAAYLGALPPLRSPVRLPTAAFGVFPFVYRVEAWPDAFLTSAEVAAVHRFSLERLVAGEGRGRFRYVGSGHDMDLPCVDLDGARVWGLTLRMVDLLLERLGP